MSTEQSYVGRGNYATLPQKSAKKSQSKARPIKKRLPLQTPPPTPSASPKKTHYTQKWQNAPMEDLGNLLAIKQRLVKANPARSVVVGSDGSTIRVKQRGSVSVSGLSPLKRESANPSTPTHK